MTFLNNWVTNEMRTEAEQINKSGAAGGITELKKVFGSASRTDGVLVHRNGKKILCVVIHKLPQIKSDQSHTGYTCHFSQ